MSAMTMAARGAAIRSNASDAWQAALRLLSVRDRSSTELHSKLQQRGFTEEAIAAALQRAAELGYLDDHRFAQNRARSLVRQGKAVGARLKLELQRYGLDTRDIDQACASASDEYPPEQVLRELLERRYSDFNYHQASDKERSRVVRFFQRRGFPISQVLSILKEER